MGLVRRFSIQGLAVRLLLCFRTFTHLVQSVDPIVQAKSRTRRRIGYEGEQNGQFALLAAVEHRSPRTETEFWKARPPQPPCAEL
jgi:hypothetical protein